ncbi:uncharacterized protein KY384_006872 [Bacidia gigantensis]|uniref:uncharacterized protein n=1 Tax=Bacidia gigantensis TaxID=2732470 RepID=UPI001D05A783|nr:uncharacterized protein KY384_006872 [Bacidia gigantensis]KAG8527956.1 hypothetical protein KY384_006872 [Bacidia gigantensis]
MSNGPPAESGPKELTANDMRLVSIAVAHCLKNPEGIQVSRVQAQIFILTIGLVTQAIPRSLRMRQIDYGLLAKHHPFKNAATASVSWNRVKRKLLSLQNIDPSVQSVHGRGGAKNSGGQTNDDGNEGTSTPVVSKKVGHSKPKQTVSAVGINKRQRARSQKDKSTLPKKRAKLGPGGEEEEVVADSLEDSDEFVKKEDEVDGVDFEGEPAKTPF